MDIREELISVIKQAFPQAEVTGENKAQGFQTPCFFVQLISTERDREVGRRYREHQSYVIQYFTHEAYPLADHLRVAGQLFEITERLPENKVRALKFYGDTIDGVLNVKVGYERHLLKERPQMVKMGQLDNRGNIGCQEH